MKFTKDQTIMLSVPTLASIAAALGAVWIFAQPIVETALAGEIEEKLKPLEAKIGPLSDSFEVIVMASVRNMRNQIAAMEFRRLRDSENWTARDEQDLSAARAELVAAEAALTTLREAKR